MSTLRERVKTLERQLQAATGGQNLPGEGAGGSGEAALLRAQLEDALVLKREREEALIAAKRHLADQAAELTRAHRTVSELQAAGECMGDP
jgi:hypothetical protein